MATKSSAPTQAVTATFFDHAAAEPGYLEPWMGVPNSLRDEINAALDREIAKVPEAEADREYLYSRMLEAFNRTGKLPDFKIERKLATVAEGERS